MFCSHCGKEISDDSQFCGFCGKSLDSRVRPTTSDRTADEAEKSSDKLIKKFVCSYAVGTMLSKLNNVSGTGYVYEDRIEFHSLLFKPDVWMIQDIAELSVRNGVVFNSLQILLKSGKRHSLHLLTPKSNVPEEVVAVLRPRITAG